jgi:hypothetical protein
LKFFAGQTGLLAIFSAKTGLPTQWQWNVKVVNDRISGNDSIFANQISGRNSVLSKQINGKDRNFYRFYMIFNYFTIFASHLKN